MRKQTTSTTVRTDETVTVELHMDANLLTRPLKRDLTDRLTLA